MKVGDRSVDIRFEERGNLTPTDTNNTHRYTHERATNPISSL